MKVVQQYRITDPKNPKLLNFVGLLINKNNNVIETWKLAGLLGRSVIWSKPIKEGSGEYAGTKAILNEYDGNPYGRLVFGKDLLHLTVGDTGSLVDVNGVIRNAEYLGAKTAQANSFFQFPTYIG